MHLAGWTKGIGKERMDEPVGDVELADTMIVDLDLDMIQLSLSSRTCCGRRQSQRAAGTARTAMSRASGVTMLKEARITLPRHSRPPQLGT